jgi:predicted amidohydrolase
MRLAIFQGPEQQGEPAANLDRLAAAAEAAARDRARLLVCPELFLTGYNIGPEAVHHLAEAAEGPSAGRVAAIARASGVAILYGYPERAADGCVFNAAQLLERDGRRLLNYRKCHLFGELDRAMFAAGEGVVAVAEIDGLRLGVLICYDVEFPEAVRLQVLAGADLVAVPTALMQPYDIVARTIVPARAYESQVYLAYANHCGREGGLTYCGLSCVVGPAGADLARAGWGEELIVAEIDQDRLYASRASNTHLIDRRPELYGPLTGAAAHG